MLLFLSSVVCEAKSLYPVSACQPIVPQPNKLPCKSNKFIVNIFIFTPLLSHIQVSAIQIYLDPNQHRNNFVGIVPITILAVF